MKLLLIPALGLMLTACSIHVDTDEKTGDVRNVHVSIGSLGGVKGNGKAATENRTMAAVKEVESTGSVDVDIRIGDTPGLVVSGDENLLPLIETEVSGDRLTIRTRKSFSTDQPLKVVVTTPSLSRVKHTGSGDVSVDGLKEGDLDVESTGSGETRVAGKVASLGLRMIGSGDFSGESLMPANVKVDLTGSGDVLLGSVTVERFEASIKGSGSVTAKGIAKQLVGSVMGSGDLQLDALKSETAEVSVLGSGDVAISASQAIKATATGSGEITVHGQPAKQEINGKNVTIVS
ncbi:head GIN domain-containing protein [Chitinimonas sp. BJYL2]|uniref:head GIN domain-containing protein n=1 Tax=Chitinimonas sp. BJYL2 TaxID=2976696 RepID=UPI0022B3C896|nr:head GIN domain-containing protein [Chitinimonas sp. BJYL2]